MALWLQAIIWTSYALLSWPIISCYLSMFASLGLSEFQDLLGITIY